ncbi:ABC transporter substrate-binding protein [Polycladidibacter stylochi]|uniref:ABC transporter substrate-binding protein n=1 Tax=Polycladidibacter stylochi TaxID=1807766 RepID=UPI0008325BEB
MFVKHVLGAMGALALMTLPSFAVTVKSCDREVDFNQPPKAAVSNDVSLTEMMLVLGLQDRMVGYSGVSGWRTLDAELRKGVKKLPELSKRYPSKEVLVGAGADFYFAGWNYGMKVGGEITPETLAPFGIKVYELSESCIHIGPKDKVSLNDMYRDLLNLGRIFGVEARAEELVAGYKQELAALKDSYPRPEKPLKVFLYDSGEDKPFTAGRYAMPTAMIEAAGGVNIMDDVQKSWTLVGWESVVERNPDVIIIVNYGEVTAEQKIEFMKNNPAFSELNAVKNDRFVVLEYVEATPGPRNIRAIKKLLKAFWG